MVWVQFIIFAISLTVALWEHFRKPAAGHAHRWSIPILLSISFLASGWLAYNVDRQAKRSRVDADTARNSEVRLQDEIKKLRADSLTQMSRIEGKLGNEQMTQQYLGAVRNLTQQYANANTAHAAEKFFGAQGE